MLRLREIIAVTVSILALTFAFTSTSRSHAPVVPAAAKWTYKTLFAGGGFPGDAQLNEFGAEGWELVSVAYNGAAQNFIYVFKKPL